MIRKTFFWIHLAVGITAGALILLMSITGVMLGFERQLIAWWDGHPRVEANGAAPLALDTLLARAELNRADVASIAVRRHPAEPVQVRLRAQGGAPATLLRLDPTTGATLTPSGTGKAQVFFSALRRWHRWVGASTEKARAAGRLANGTANLLFLGLVLSGFYLWWPRHWTWARLRATTLPSLKGHGRGRDFNWHNSLGFWMALPLAAIVISGTFIGFRWPGLYLDRALGSAAEQEAAKVALAGPAAAPASAAAGAGGGATSATGGVTGAAMAAAPRTRAASPMAEASVHAWFETTRTQYADWGLVTITMPSPRDSVVRVAVAEGNTYRPDLRNNLVLARTGEVREATGYAELSAARQIRAWMRFGHTGEVFGIPGQLLATIASAVGCVLVYTGVALAWRRLMNWRRRRRRAASRAQVALVPGVAAAPDTALEPPAPLGGELDVLAREELAVHH